MDIEIRWSPRATQQLEGICEYIARDSSTYAAAFAQRMLQTIQTIREHPRSGRVVPEYGEPSLRGKIYQGYRIVYRIKDNNIEIAAICHGSRQLENVISYEEE